jgi:chromosome partitioning protein
MRVIALVAQKGGVGKTTISINLAVALQKAGFKVAVLDLDKQDSASIWFERREAQDLHVEFLNERKLPATLAVAKGQGFDFAIIDTPPAAGTEAIAALEAADLVLVPCRPSLIDLDAIKKTGNLFKSSNTPGFVVFNAAPATATALLEDATAIVQASGLAAAPVIIRERSAFRASWPVGKGVNETGPGSKAAQEINELMSWVLSIFQINKPEVVQKTKSGVAKKNKAEKV